MSESKLRIALVGCGNIVANGHAPALDQVADRIEVVAVCDAFRGNAERLAARFGLPESAIFENVEDVAASPGIDAALVSTPHFKHHDNVMTLLSGGKHVLVEKPMALNAQEAAEMTALAEEKGLQLVVGHCQRHSPAGLAIRDILADGYLGNVFGVQATALQYLPMYVPVESNHWLYSAERAGGGIVISVAVHKLDLLRFLLGEVDTASSLFEIDPDRSSAQRPFEWTASVNLKFASGAVASLFACYKAYSDVWAPETLQILGDQGTIRATGWDDFEIASTVLPKWARGFVRHTPKADSDWVAQWKAFYDTVVDGKPNRANAREGVKTMALIDAIYASGAQDGQPVKPANPLIENQTSTLLQHG